MAAGSAHRAVAPWIAALVVVVVMAGGCRSEGSGSAGPTTTATPAASTTTSAPPVPEGTFVSDEGGFSVELPGTPTRMVQQQPVGDVILEVVVWNLDVGDDQAYQIAYVDYPQSLGPLDPEGVLDGAARGSAGAVGGTLLDATHLDYRGHRAVAFEIELDGAHVSARSVLVGRRLYTIQAVTLAPPAPAFERMVASFQLR